MTISVLMSVYKSEKGSYLDRAMKSVWDDQTYKPSQIILIEDGPLTDELYRVIDKWDKKLGDILCLIKNEQNIGLTKSLNKGLKKVTSELIARMDSDDQSLPKRFELQEKYLREHPDIDILGGTDRIVDKDGNLKRLQIYKLTHDEIVKQMCWRCPVSHPGVMLRNSMFTEKGLSYNEEFRNSQDIALWVDAVIAGCKMANLEDEMINFTEDGDVYSRRGKVRAMNEYKSFSKGAKYIFGTYSPRRILPVVRYCSRRMPVFMIKWMYESKILKRILNG